MRGVRGGTIASKNLLLINYRIFESFKDAAEKLKMEGVIFASCPLGGPEVFGGL